MKTFNGKAIYQPAGRAAEYAQWACNFYTGCSNNCDYCYCKRGRMAHTWSNMPKLKARFKNETHALEVFEKELKINLTELQKHGLFFSFTTDPMLPETKCLTWEAIAIAARNGIRSKTLTKKTDWVFPVLALNSIATKREYAKYWAIGFTLTGHDELEPGASTNNERIEAMRKLHDAGFLTWASIEPIVDFRTSGMIIKKCIEYDWCNLYKIGLMSGKKYEQKEIRDFVDMVLTYADYSDAKIYFKDSLLAQAGIRYEELPENCVKRDYNIFD